MDDSQKDTNDDATENDAYSHNFENTKSESLETARDCQGCGRYSGKFTCQDCRDKFCTDCITVRGIKHPENVCLICG